MDLSMTVGYELIHPFQLSRERKSKKRAENTLPFQ